MPVIFIIGAFLIYGLIDLIRGWNAEAYSKQQQKAREMDEKNQERK